MGPHDWSGEREDTRARRRLASAIRMVGVSGVLEMLAEIAQNLGEQAERQHNWDGRRLWWECADLVEQAMLAEPEGLRACWEAGAARAGTPRNYDLASACSGSRPVR